MTTTPEHRWKQYGPDDVYCVDCGQEPWMKAKPCTGPHPTATTRQPRPTALS